MWGLRPCAYLGRHRSTGTGDGMGQSRRPPWSAENVMCRVASRIGIFRSVSVGISRYLPYRYRRKTRSVFSVSKFWREPLKKLAGAPFFPRRGGLGPLFVHFALLLKKKRNSRGIILQKKSSRDILKRCSRQILQYNNTDQKIPIPAVSDTGKYRYRNND